MAGDLCAGSVDLAAVGVPGVLECDGAPLRHAGCGVLAAMS
jgi:hypothetical protein